MQSCLLLHNVPGWLYLFFYFFLFKNYTSDLKKSTISGYYGIIDAWYAKKKK